MDNEVNLKSLENYIYEISLGNIEALEKLYNETRLDVYKVALSIMKNTSDAEDIMQDTFVNINKYAHLYKVKNKPLAWILTITKNLCYNKIKKNNRTINEEVDDKLKTKKDQVFNSVLLTSIIESMNDEERQIFTLSSIDNFKFREIANLLNLNISTVLSKYNRAMKKIKEVYKEGV